MSLTVTSSTADLIEVTDSDGVSRTVPRNLGNREFQVILDASRVTVAQDASRYLAFPYAIEVGSSIVGIYSNSDAHASGSTQIMFRTDDESSFDFATFYDNGVYDTSLLSDLMIDGDVLYFKGFRVSKSGGVISVENQNTIDIGGTIYAVWGRVHDIGGDLYRTAYVNAKSYLLKSTDEGVGWTVQGTIAEDGAKSFSEADIAHLGGTDLLAVIREDLTGNRAMFWTTSSDLGVTWAAETQFSTSAINGTQPNLTMLASGDVLLMAGDRTGRSGYDAGGQETTQRDITGIAAWLYDTSGGTWGYRTMLDRMYSTDGGQPMAVQVTGDDILAFYYKRLSEPTNPIIGMVRFRESSLV